MGVGWAVFHAEAGLGSGNWPLSQGRRAGGRAARDDRSDGGARGTLAGRRRGAHIKAGERHGHGAKSDTTMGRITITPVGSKATWR